MRKKLDEFLYNNSLYVTIVLVLLLAVVMIDFTRQIVSLAIFLLPYFFLTYKWNLKKLERIILALPLSALATLGMYLLSAFGIGTPVVVTYLLLIGLPLIVSIAFYRIKIQDDVREMISKKTLWNKTLFYALFIGAVTIFLYQGFITTKFTPAGDALGYLARSYSITNSLTYQNTVFHWYDKAQLGYPIFTFDPHLSYFFTGFYTVIAGNGILANFNFLFIIFIIFMTLGAFLLGRELFNSEKWGLVVALLFIASPVIAMSSANIGNFKLFSAYAVLPAFFYFLIKRDEKPLSILVLLVTYMFLSHASVGLLALFYLVAHILANWIKERFNLATIIDDVFFLGNYLALAFVTILYFIVPVIVYTEYSSKVAFVLQPGAVLEQITSALFRESAISPDFNIGIGYGIGVAIAVVVILYELIHKKTSFIYPILGTFMLLIILLVIGTTVDTVAKTFAGIEKITPFLSLFYAIFIAYLVYWVTEYGITKNNTLVQAIGVVVLVVFLYHYGSIVHARTVAYIIDTDLDFFTHISDSQEYKQMFGDVTGRVATYSFFGPTLHPTLEILNVSTNGVGYTQGQHTDLLERIIGGDTEKYKDRGLPQNTNPEKIMTLYRMTHTNNIYLDGCSESGKDVIEKFKACQMCRFSFVKALRDCYLMLVLETAFVEGFTVIPTENNYETLGKEKIEHVRENPGKIVITSPESKYLFVKEEYFPNWHAYQDGVEILITKSDIGLMVVESKNKQDINLVYELSWWEKLLSFLSIGTIYAFMFFPYENFNLRRSTT